MKHFSGVHTRWASVAAGAALTVTVTGAGMAPAQSATDSSCPAPYPETQLTSGQPVHGLTVEGSAGPLGTAGATQPDAFSGTVLGVVTDGIAPGMDMIMVRLTSPEIDRVGGIWEGMSGSPVYASDGRLIGAVAYGLSSGPSPVAGVTPAAEMEALLDQAPASTSAPAARVAVPDRLARVVAASSDVTRQQLSDGFSELRLPFGISGLAGKKRLHEARKLLGIRGVRMMQTGAVGSDATPSPIQAGGNLAASMSYGDVTTAGVGTVTAVCGSEVLAFGHPMNDTGPATLTLHGADAIYIQEDPSAPFKVANVTAPLGTVNGDRLAGLHGVLGGLPTTSHITSYVESDGRSRTGTTSISVPDAVPDIATMHLMADQDRVFDGVGAGSGTVSWVIRGQRQDGTDFRLRRTDVYADPADLSGSSAFSLYDTLSQLEANGSENITISSVRTRSVLDRDYRHYLIGRVQVRWAGRWVTADPNGVLPVRAGHLLRMRAQLTSTSLGNRWVRVSVRVPHRAAGKIGALDVFGGNSGDTSGLGDLFGLSGGGLFLDSSQPAPGFGAVLRQLRRAPHHDDVVATLSLFSRRGPDMTRTGTRSAGQVVDGGVSLQVVGLR
ncbi:MAG TPA: hypothetical protein VFT75_01605 [Nocardioidaceae bacterium]|jgi:hypothetical protein|nr:hypothetical protein [Nocardioidaceae bacterium]